MKGLCSVRPFGPFPKYLREIQMNTFTSRNINTMIHDGIPQIKVTFYY